ncbi:dynamin-like protein ARC5 [Tanacetum coccineum]
MKVELVRLCQIGSPWRVNQLKRGCTIVLLDFNRPCLASLPLSSNRFNCFFLMPVVDKLPVLLREDLESAFEDDLDNVFDITILRHALGQRKRETEIEMKRVF